MAQNEKGPEGLPSGPVFEDRCEAYADMPPEPANNQARPGIINAPVVGMGLQAGLGIGTPRSPEKAKQFQHDDVCAVSDAGVKPCLRRRARGCALRE